MRWSAKFFIPIAHLHIEQGIPSLSLQGGGRAAMSSVEAHG